MLAKGNGANGRTISLSGMGRAASDDASELSVANTAASSAVAGAEREAYADVAPAEGEGKRCRAGAASPRRRRNKNAVEKKEVPGGTDPLPVDAEAFVDAVHSRVDLVLLEERLLHSLDDKIVQRELAYLRELRYGKRAGPSDDEPTQIIFDMPGPERDKQ
ncbi:MAG: hypothetical protein JWO71_638 [Candidatus Acidoferrum typicum]|nr:hypothetical protein [Candidatus Acidoferrum typicum]